MSSLFRYKLTSGEIEQIAKIYQSGISISAINRAYGFSFRSRVIENALHRAGIEVLKGKRKISLSKEQDIISDYLSGMNNYQLSDKYGIWPSAIHSLLKRHNIETRNNRDLSDNQEENLIEDYSSGMSVQALNMKYNTTNSHRILIRHNVQTRKAGHNSRKYSLNEHAFDDLNNELSAYWLGFIYADGGINKETLSIGLSIKDINHLEKFRSFLEYELPVEKYQAKTPKGNMNDYCRLTVHSKIITGRLRDLGILKKRPNFNLILSELPEQSYKYFIRGNVDGDGSIEITKRGNTRIRFLGQTDMLNWISDLIHSELQLPKRNIYARPGIYGMEYSGTLMAQKIINWLYQDAQVFLDRKIGSITWFENKKGE